MNDQDWIAYSLKLAQCAAAQDEVPVGAVLVYKDEMVGEGWNRPIAMQDPTAHAEVQAIRQAADKIGNYRLLDTTLYVTLEPCMMCVGTMIQARIGRLVYGADDPKAGAVKSVVSLLDSVQLNHRIQWKGGILAKECGQMLSHFFKEKRRK